MFSNIDLLIQDNKIVFVNTFKLLGVLIDILWDVLWDLNFPNHVLNVCKLVNRSFSIISQNKSLFNPEMFKEILFKSLIILSIELVIWVISSLFIPINQFLMNKVEKCIAKSLKQILNLLFYGLDGCQVHKIQLSLLKPSMTYSR